MVSKTVLENYADVVKRERNDADGETGCSFSAHRKKKQEIQ